MREINLFCFGFGQVAKSFVEKIISQKLKVNLVVTSREKSKKKYFNKIQFESLQFNENSFDKNIIEKLKIADHILVSIAPVKGSDIVLNNFKEIIKHRSLKWLTYLSATSVYGNHNGEWVDEESETIPSSPKGIERLKAEISWMNAAKAKDLPLQIFRLSGLYSNEKNILIRLKSGNEKIIDTKNHFFSRIHIEDVANILFKSLDNFKAKEIYNISDDKPASSKEVALHGSKILKIKEPETIKASSIESETLKNFYKDSKKVSNKKMKIFFNYRLKFPSYIEGLNHIRNNFI